MTAELTPGLNDAAELLRQQLEDAGIRLKINTVNTADYLGDIPRLHRAKMLSLFVLNRPFLSAIPMLLGNDNLYNYGGWYPADFATTVERRAERYVPNNNSNSSISCSSSCGSKARLLWGLPRSAFGCGSGIGWRQTQSRYPVIP